MAITGDFSQKREHWIFIRSGNAGPYNQKAWERYKGNLVSYDPVSPELDWEPVQNENFWADDPGYVQYFSFDTQGVGRVTKFDFIDGPAPDFISGGLMDFDYKGTAS